VNVGSTAGLRTYNAGSLEDVDLSLLLVDHEKFPKSIKVPRMQLCEAPPWPGDPVIVVDAGHASRSHIVSPQVLPYTLRNKFPTLIGMSLQPEIQDLEFSIPIANALSAS
jgi:hypothetical protein